MFMRRPLAYEIHPRRGCRGPQNSSALNWNFRNTRELPSSSPPPLVNPTLLSRNRLHLPPSRLIAAVCAAALLLASQALADAVLKISGTAGLAELGRTDLPFNFHDGPPGIDGAPFQIAAFGAHGALDTGATPPSYGEKNGEITADYAGKFNVSVRWTNASGANRVFADVTITNHLSIPIIEYGLRLLKLRFPTSVTANDGNPNLRAYNTGSPGIFIANYGGAHPGALVCDLEGADASQPLLMKLERATPSDPTGALTVMNHHDYEDNGSPFLSWPVPAHGAVHFRIGLRFTGPRPDPNVICADLFSAFAHRYPVMDNIRAWRDRRPIAQVFFESGSANAGLNPRKWFDAGEHVDVTTPSGIQRFEKLVLDRARSVVDHMKKMNAQGVITWDIEGAQFPGATYMGDPSKLATADPAQSVAPEMARIADRYFKIYRDAGYRLGVTIRPQRVIIQRDAGGHIALAWEFEDNWDWKTAPPPDIQAFWQHELEAKIRFARQRWGATLFYIDSNGDPGSPVSFLVMRNLAAEFPDVLLIPEQSTMGYYSASAPYRQLNRLAPWNITSPVVRHT